MQSMTPRAAAARALAMMFLLLGVLGGCVAFTVNSGYGGQSAYACDQFGQNCQPTVTVGTTQTIPGGGGSDGTVSCVGANGNEIPCQTDQGFWYAPFGCYLQAIPQDQWPAATDPIYKGHDPSEGTLYSCSADFTFSRYVFIVGRPPVDPAVLVAQAVVSLDLEPVTMGTAPQDGADMMGLVGLPAWMWVDQPGPHTFGPISDSASDGPVSVTLTANVTQVSWDMGDGSAPVICDGPGTPYQASYGKSGSPTCGYRYQATSADQPGGTYTVTATASWVVTWSSNTGATGLVRLTRVSQEQLRIGEAQVLVQ